MNLDALIEALKKDEGLRLLSYLDTAKPPRVTIGYGRNLSDKGISPNEAHDMLVSDAIAALRNACALVPNWAGLDTVRQNVLGNMAFNLGRGGLAGFPKMLAAVNEGRYADAAAEMKKSVWFTQVGARAVRLAQEMQTGQVA